MLFRSVAATTLAGCGNPYYPIGPGPETVRLSGWIGNGTPAPIDTVHCYATIGAPDCYAKPQPGISNRWIGSYVAGGGTR